MNTWKIGDTCVLGRTSQVFWTVEHVYHFSDGGQYGLMITRNYGSRIIKKIVSIGEAIPRKRIN